ncbi:MAG TPA: hypothetical protein VIJ51_10725 [Solirubrobacteraceae bacterium]
MDDREPIAGLRSLPAPDAAAAHARATNLILAAHASRRREPRRRPGWLTAVAATLAIAVGSAAAQGAAVAHWAQQAWRASIGAGGGRPAAATALPGDGRLLVWTGLDAWIVGQGLTRPVGHTAGGEVSWSAFGNYVACACGETLDAVALNGRIAWTERFGLPVESPLWSPDGNRIAFGVGRELYVTAGNATGARGLRPLPAGGLLSAAAWRPGAGDQLAVNDAQGRISVIDTDTGRDAARLPIGRDPVSVGWSANGRRLLVATRRTLRVYDATGGLIAQVPTPRGAAITAARIAPSRRQIAYLADDARGRQEAVLAPVGRGPARRLLLVGASLGDLLFSPDGGWLMVGWHELDRWMFFTTGPGRTEVRQVTDVTTHAAHAAPVVVAWCCMPRAPQAGR